MYIKMKKQMDKKKHEILFKCPKSHLTIALDTNTSIPSICWEPINSNDKIISHELNFFLKFLYDIALNKIQLN